MIGLKVSRSAEKQFRGEGDQTHLLEDIKHDLEDLSGFQARKA